MDSTDKDPSTEVHIMEVQEMDEKSERKPSKDVQEKDEIFARKSSKAYASKVFKESTCGVVANIVSTKSRTRKFFKSFVLMSCLVGFLYQCTTFMALFFQYPMTIDIEIQRPKMFPVPALTFCSNNPIKRSVFCQKFPNRCTEISNEICSEFPSYCGTNKTLMPKEEYFNLEKSFSYEEILNMSGDMTELLLINSDRYNDTPTGPYIRSKYFRRGTLICYTLHSVVNSTEDPKMKKILPNILHDPINRLRFYIEDDEIFLPGDKAGVLFSIHSPYEAVNPFKDGIFLIGGHKYNILIQATQDILLKEPYGTACKNYGEEWIKNNKTGPRVQAMCMQQCLQKVFLKCHGCRHPSILYPSNEKLCIPYNFTENCKPEETDFGVQECRDFCRDDCKLIKYIPKVVERYETIFEVSAGKYRVRFHDRYINVDLYLDVNEVVTLIHSPKYLTVEAFSSLGGFIGVWLGISLLDIIDLLASVFMITRYACRKDSD